MIDAKTALHIMWTLSVVRFLIGLAIGMAIKAMTPIEQYANKIREALQSLSDQAKHVDKWLGQLHCACPTFGDKIENADAVLALPVPETPQPTWICFHCGFETADEKEASGHFGDRDDGEPFCAYWKDMPDLEKAQELQSKHAQWMESEDENMRLRTQIEGLEYRLLGAEAVVPSNFKNCTTLNDVRNEYDSMQGRALAGDEVYRRVSEALGLPEGERSIEQIVSAITSRSVAAPQAEKEWRVEFDHASGHYADLFFATERKADDCIAGKMDCGPWRFRDVRNVQKLWRTMAGPWTPVPADEVRQS